LTLLKIRPRTYSRINDIRRGGKVKRSRALWRSAGAVAGVAVALVAWRYGTLSQAAVPEVAPVQGAASVTAAGPAPDWRAPGPEERRLDVAALRRSLASRPDADAEVARIVAFARFRDQVAAYGNGRNSMPAAERAALARALLDALPEHVARNEIVPVQAEALSAVLLADSQSDPATRAAAVQSMRAQWDAYAQQSVGPSPAQDPRYLAYAQQSHDIIQQVQASVADPAQQQRVIVQRLQALRVQLFDAGASTGAH
jgi:phospholipase C accessory protein PlcR